jgi:hypothetical protein
VREQVVVDFGKIMVPKAKVAVDGAVSPKDRRSKTLPIAHCTLALSKGSNSNPGTRSTHGQQGGNLLVVSGFGLRIGTFKFPTRSGTARLTGDRWKKRSCWMVESDTGSAVPLATGARVPSSSWVLRSDAESACGSLTRVSGNPLRRESARAHYGFGIF